MTCRVAIAILSGLCVLHLHAIDATLIHLPNDTAVTSGNSATLQCRTDHGSLADVGWNWQVNSSLTHGIVRDCTVQSGFTSSFQVTSDVATGQCDLVVSSASSSDVGQYSCFDQQLAFETAYLTVVDSPTGSKSPAYVVGGDTLTLTCDVVFYTYDPLISPTPLLRWTHLSGLDVTYLYNSTTANTSTAISMAVPQGPGCIESVTCEAYFETTVVYTSPANWTSTTNISHCPVVTVNHTGGNVTRNTVFTCSASAFPPTITYEWLDSMSSITTSGQTFTLTSLDEYNVSCTATNYLYGGTSNPCSNTTSIHGFAYDEPTTTSQSADHTTNGNVATATTVKNAGSSHTTFSVFALVAELFVIYAYHPTADSAS